MKCRYQYWLWLSINFLLAFVSIVPNQFTHTHSQALCVAFGTLFWTNSQADYLGVNHLKCHKFSEIRCVAEVSAIYFVVVCYDLSLASSCAFISWRCCDNYYICLCSKKNDNTHKQTNVNRQQNVTHSRSAWNCTHSRRTEQRRRHSYHIRKKFSRQVLASASASAAAITLYSHEERQHELFFPL